MSEDVDVWALFYDGHTEGAEVFYLPFFDEGRAGCEDCAVEVKGCGE